MNTPTPSPAPLSDVEITRWTTSGACLSELECRLLATITARDHILNHIRNEVCTLEDFDAESLCKEIDETLAGTRVYDDNKHLRATITAKEEIIAGLTADVEGARSAALLWMTAANRDESRVKVLEEALRPFAAKANDFSGDAWGQYIALIGNPPHLRTSLTVGDLRRAAAALTPSDQVERT